MPQRLSLDAIRELYPPEKYILLLPAVTKHILTDNPMWALDVAEVEIDVTNPDHVYIQTEKWDGQQSVATEVSLTKIALDLLASAADVTVLPERTDDGSNPMFCRHVARCVMRTPGGDVRARSSSCDWEGEVAQDRVRLAAENYVLFRVSKQWKGYTGLTDEQVQEKIDQRFREQWIREREYGKRKNESYACNRAIAAVLAVQRTYPVDMLRGKKFAVAKFVLSPDLSDPDIKRMYIERGMQAQGQLYAQVMANDLGGGLLPAPVAPLDAPLLAAPEPAAQVPPPEEIVEQAAVQAPVRDNPAAPPAEVSPVKVEAAPQLPPTTWADTADMVGRAMVALVDYQGDDRNQLFQQMGRIRQDESVNGLMDLVAILRDKGVMDDEE